MPVDNIGTCCRGSLQWRARWTKLRKRTRGQNDTGERHLAITDSMFRSPSPLLHGSYQGTDNANNLGGLKDVSSPASVVAQNTSATNEALMNSDTVAADEVQSPPNPLDTEKSQHGNGESDFPCNDTARNEALPEMIPNDQQMISFLCNTESVSSNQPSQIIQQQESDNFCYSF